MTYRETLAQIYGLTRFGIRPGLERISALLDSLDAPQRRLRTIAIAGTNGKGSTASFLSSILAASGLRVGLFTSPHLISFTERITINGQEISEDQVVALTSRIRAAAPPDTTFFEVVTALGLLHFAESEVDVAILEAGMGGRNDATNAAEPIISIITPISLDHCEYLGSKLGEIAAEKSGIIRSGRPVLSAPQDPAALMVLERNARSSGSPFLLSGRDFSASWNDDCLVYQGLKMRLEGLKPGIPGRHQAGNAACAVAAAELLHGDGFDVSGESVRAGVSGAFWPGRLEMFPGEPRILLDGAHNPAGSLVLAEALADFPRDRLFLVAGMMGDKDAAAILEPLLPLVARGFAVTPSLERAMPAERLAGMMLEHGVFCSAAGSVAEGLRQAVAAAGPNDLVLVSGSLFTVGEARAALLNRSCEQVRG